MSQFPPTAPLEVESVAAYVASVVADQVRQVLAINFAQPEKVQSPSCAATNLDRQVPPTETSEIRETLASFPENIYGEQFESVPTAKTSDSQNSSQARERVRHSCVEIPTMNEGVNDPRRPLSRASHPPNGQHGPPVSPEESLWSQVKSLSASHFTTCSQNEFSTGVNSFTPVPLSSIDPISVLQVAVPK